MIILYAIYSLGITGVISAHLSWAGKFKLPKMITVLRQMCCIRV